MFFFVVHHIKMEIMTHGFHLGCDHFLLFFCILVVVWFVLSGFLIWLSIRVFVSGGWVSSVRSGGFGAAIWGCIILSTSSTIGRFVRRRAIGWMWPGLLRLLHGIRTWVPTPMRSRRHTVPTPMMRRVVAIMMPLWRGRISSIPMHMRRSIVRRRMRMLWVVLRMRTRRVRVTMVVTSMRRLAGWDSLSTVPVIFCFLPLTYTLWGFWVGSLTTSIAAGTGWAAFCSIASLAWAWACTAGWTW
mmetsp:Transcript_33350/g.50287  ORF Transcript_33350/g.50287 Transcript_33350/m.50287 type:complete len:243 (+) Transcript_33350:354-1082(+)